MVVGRTAPKAQLQFHQQPLEGPRHHYGAPQLPVTHTRKVPSKPIDHSTVTSWVIPEFDTEAESCHRDQRKRQRRDQPRRASRKSVSKFPHLNFENPVLSLSSATSAVPPVSEHPKHLEQKICKRSPLVPVLSPQSFGEPSDQACQSFPHVFIPTGLQTPEPASDKQGLPAPAQRENNLPVCLLQAQTPKNTEPGPVLVEDTPEENYGIRVTWRRRRHLMAYLRERGKLSRSQIYVKI